MAEDSGGGPILHVVVVGFHHKKGCQVEYSYPPLIEGNPVDSHDLPDEWKHLPSLALPDGAHNFTKDTTFFHLVARDGSNSTVYGVSCYRQMDSNNLINRTADVTRSSVQKSVCVLSKLPLYGAIQTKLEMITHAYFDERDFSQVSLLHETYTNLVTSFPGDPVDPSQAVHGLRPCELALTFHHKILVLFKLMLLERRVLLYGTPVYQCSNILLSLLSLFPEMIERGLSQSAMYSKHDQLSPTMDDLSFDDSDFIEVRFHQSSGDEGHMSRDTSGDIEVLSESSENEVTGTATVDGCDPRNVTKSDKSTNICRGQDVIGHISPLNKDCDISNSDEILMSNNDKTRTSSKVHDNGLYNVGKKNGQGFDTQMGDITNDTDKSYESLVQHKADVSDKSSPLDDSDTTQDMSDVDFTTLHTPESPKSPIISFDVLHDPLSDIAGITNTENIQSIVDLSYSTENTSLQTTNTGHPVKTIRIPSLDEVKQIGSEEIDSPESINKIDQEDCFSWEDDRLTLEIDHELGLSDKNVSISSAFDIDIDRPPDQIITRNADSHDAQMSVIVLDRGDSKPVEDVIDQLNEQTKDDQQTHTIDGRTIRNRLVSAFASLGKTKSENDKTRFKHLSSGEDAKYILNPDHLGFPLAIFTKGSLCHPYLCLQYYDLLHDVNVRSFVIGASNILFRQKRNLVDVVVDISEAKLEINDPELRKQLTLSTADLRFADYLVKTVAATSGNSFLHGTEWEGGNEWLRAQFKLYLQSLLAASIHPDTKSLEDYHPAFVSAWSTTRNYRVWHKLDHTAYAHVSPSHPCHGNLSVTDLKVKWTSTMQGTERGRRLNSAVTQTGKYVVQTGKVVGKYIGLAPNKLTFLTIPVAGPALELGRPLGYWFDSVHAMHDNKSCCTFL